MRKILAFAMALVLSCACLGACSTTQPAQTNSLQDARYVAKETMLLETPDSNAKVLAKVSIGKVAKLVGEEGNYSRVRALGKEGYILTADLVDSEADAKAAKKAAEEEAAKAEEAARKAAEEAAARAEAEEKARLEAEEKAKADLEAEAQRAARAEQQAQADAAAQAQARAAAEAAASAEAEAQARAAAEAAKAPTVVSKSYVPPCDGHANGYTVITYSDGTEELVEGKA